MIDFTNCERIKRIANDGESKKEWIFYSEKSYLLKAPSLYKINKDSTYYNQCFSEYVSCHVFNSIGVYAQNTLIGINNTKDNIVVACEDVTFNNYYKLLKLSNLKDIIKVKNKDGKRLFENGEKVKCSTKYEDKILSSFVTNSILDIYNIINSQDLIDKTILKNYFWDIFVADAFVNNIDRDIKNIGILYDEIKKEYLLSPVYDLGRSLYDYIKLDNIIKIINGDINLLKEKINVGSFSVLRDEDGKHINFISYFKYSKNKDFREAVDRIKHKIDFNIINEIIDSTPLLSIELKKFYNLVLNERFRVLFQNK